MDFYERLLLERQIDPSGTRSLEAMTKVQQNKNEAILIAKHKSIKKNKTPRNFIK